MATTIRLTRMGRKKRPFYRLVVLDSRKRRDGAYLANLGYYNPFTDPHEVELHTDDIISWLGKGATVSETARSLLKAEGVLYRFSLVRQGLEAADIEQRMGEWIDTAAARKRDAADAAVAKREAVRDARVTREEEAKAKAAEAAAAEAAGEKAAAAAKAAEEAAEKAAEKAAEEATEEAAEAAGDETAAETPAETAPAEETAAETPAEAAPAEETPAETPAEAAPAEETPAEDAPAETAEDAKKTAGEDGAS